MKKKYGLVLLCMLLAGCGKTSNDNGKSNGETTQDSSFQETESSFSTIEDTDSTTENETESIDTEAGYDYENLSKEDQEKIDLFGENCIPEQTFEVEMDSSGEKSWFISLREGTSGLTFRIEKDGEVKNSIESYRPENLSKSVTPKVDAVSIMDVNFDGNKDIVTVQTYGSDSYVVVYECDEITYYDSTEVSYSYYCWENSCEILNQELKDKSIDGFSEYLSGGIQNGAFETYEQAYEAVCKYYDLHECSYDLVYVDGDDIPELSVGISGYWVSLFCYRDGKVSCPMYMWAYGAGGNHGYMYAEKKNSLLNCNSDYAGAIYYETYMKISEDYQSIEVTDEYKYINFVDVNGNGDFDGEDYYDDEAYLNDGPVYVNGVLMEEKPEESYTEDELLYLEGQLTHEDLVKREWK